MQKKGFLTDNTNVLSRHDYQEILLARMAAGDLYANEERMKIRKVDIMLDKFREALGKKALYKKETGNKGSVEGVEK